MNKTVIIIIIIYVVLLIVISSLMYYYKDKLFDTNNTQPTTEKTEEKENIKISTSTSSENPTTNNNITNNPIINNEGTNTTATTNNEGTNNPTINNSTITNTPTPSIDSLQRNFVDTNLLFIGDISGGDIIGSDNLNYINVSNIDKCLFECTKNNECVSFVYQPFLNNGKIDSLNPPSISNSNTQKCWLKNTKGTVNISDSTKVWYKGDVDTFRTNSYNKSDAHPYKESIDFNTSYLLPTTIDYINGDIKILSNITESNCFSECKQNSNCLTFKYNDSYKNCYLKDGTGQYVNSENKNKMYTGPIDYSHAPFISNMLTTDNTNYSELRIGKIYNKETGKIPTIGNGIISNVLSINDCSSNCKTRGFECDTFLYDRNNEKCYLLKDYDIYKPLTSSNNTIDKIKETARKTQFENEKKQIVNDSTKYEFIWSTKDRLNLPGSWVHSPNYYKYLSPKKDFSFNDASFIKGDIEGGDIGTKPIKVNNNMECYYNCLYTKGCYNFVYDSTNKECKLKNINGKKIDGNKDIYTGLINDGTKFNKYNL